MPHLHPFYENEDRHFTEDSARPVFPISRRVRQKYHSKKDPEGHYHIVRSRYDTFPAMSPLQADLEALMDEQFDGTIPPDAPERRQALEDEERARWKQGIDVMERLDDLVWDLFGPQNICQG